MKKNIVLLLLILNVLIYSKEDYNKYYIKEFKIKNFFGTWYEIARTETFFQNNMDYVKTTYNPMKDGDIEIITKGFNIKKNKNVIIKGKGRLKFDDIENIFEAKFFALNYSDFIILDYDRKNYSYVVIRGEDLDYFWILSRKSNLEKKTLDKLIEIAKKDGVNLEKLVIVKQ